VLNAVLPSSARDNIRQVLTARMQGDTLLYSAADGNRNPAPQTHELEPDSLHGDQ